MAIKATVYNTKGKESGSIDLPEALFGAKWNGDLVHQVVTSILSSKRTPVAHTKNRGDVAGGGKKPWKQKGTGRARHGSTRSPIWVGGGVAHGPRNEKNYDRKVNNKQKIKALATILSKKFTDGEVLFVDEISFKEPKTKDAKGVLESISKIKGFEKILSKKNNALCLATSKKDTVVEKSFGNFKNVEVLEARNINPIELLSSKYILIENPEVSLKTLSSRLSK